MHPDIKFCDGCGRCDRWDGARIVFTFPIPGPNSLDLCSRCLDEGVWICCLCAEIHEGDCPALATLPEGRWDKK